MAYVANRISRLRRDHDDGTSTLCNVTLYEDCHRMHVSTSQLHECNKCCLRYKTKSLATPQDTHIGANLEASIDAIKDPKKHNLIQVCRFRAPWLERMCKACYKPHRSLRYDICESCFNTVPTDKNAPNVPYQPQLETKVECRRMRLCDTIQIIILLV